MTEETFRQVLKKQCSAEEAKENGAGYVQLINQSFAPLLAGSSSIGFNAEVGATSFTAKGLDKDNAYLHVRGHNIYDLSAYIGRMFSTPLRINFESDVMGNATIGCNYWEYKEMENDLKSF